MDINTVTLQFSASYAVALRNLADVTHEESLAAPEPGGNSLNWVVGHLLGARNRLLEVLGQDRLCSEQEDHIYRRGSDPITMQGARPFAELVELFRRSQVPLIAGLQEVGPERLREAAPFSPGGNPDETIGSLLAVFAFHEAYHVGQTGLLRRVAGHPGAIS